MTISLRAYFKAIQDRDTKDDVVKEAHEALDRMQVIVASRMDEPWHCGAQKVFEAISSGKLDVETSHKLAETMEEFVNQKLDI